MPPHAFASISPEQQRVTIAAADIWPVVSIVQDPGSKQLLATVRHHKAKVDVKGVPLAGGEVESSLALWWAVATGQLPALDLDTLQAHHSGYWGSFRSAAAAFIDWASKEPPLRRAAAQGEAASYVSAFGDAAIRAASFPEFVSLLAGEAELPKGAKMSRVALCHWLSSWHAGQLGLAMPSPPPQRLDEGASLCVPAPTPLSSKEWFAELARRSLAEGSDGTLALPGAVGLLVSKQPPAAGGPVAQAPAWEAVIDGALEAGPLDITRVLQAIEVVPETSCSNVGAAIALIAKTFSVNARCQTFLAQATSTALLTGALKSVWSSAPPGLRAPLHAELCRLADKLEEKWGSTSSPSLRRAALQKIHAVLQEAERQGFRAWDEAALAVSLHDRLPISIFSCMGGVKELSQLRPAILSASSVLQTSAEFEALVEAVKVATQKPPDDDLGWFAQGLPPPPQPVGRIGSPIKAATRPPIPRQLSYTSSASDPSPPTSQPWLTLPLQPTGGPAVPGLQPPGTLPPSRQPHGVHGRLVKVTHLRGRTAAELTASLSVVLSRPVLVTPQAAQRGYGFFETTASEWHHLFGADVVRVYTAPEGWSISLHGELSPREPWTAAPGELLSDGPTSAAAFTDQPRRKKQKPSKPAPKHRDGDSSSTNAMPPPPPLHPPPRGAIQQSLTNFPRASGGIKGQPWGSTQRM